MIINKALIKHGYSKFKLDILEYCDPKDLVKREQYYLDLLSPEYNVLRLAYSSLGYKHTKETMVKVSKNLVNLTENKSIKVKVTNLETNVWQEYVSLREAAKSLETNKTTLKKYILNSIPYKGIYKLESNLTVSNFDSNYINHPSSVQIEVHDLELKTITTYTSIHSTSRALGIGHNTISNFFRRNQIRPYKGRYIFKKVA
uniref:GIY-YIG endonuclease n=1 Tax=Monilinia laxa TaxID=61186 RepID=A0A7L8EY88_MONLA|nr:GIY-YIG endonuclease [Monilinia laxa]QOE17426.1 GIY-YIG endonuclease [Monilinia laxa]QYB19857.1 GIY-YIG endonuclease [Monilinia laxa]QYB19942.1 GIY-YIG endonuclease [Monilinia laxa]QYB20026.1 GIY-YIG endonuclease [Monilinia laxa]QYB20092.1 GIY-YIG endonuclease [Monilinia laxa]